jgi:hypothetical protein
MKNEQDLDPNSVVQIRGSGYVSKCHRPGTLTESLKMQYGA